jgi:hypothetical protein
MWILGLMTLAAPWLDAATIRVRRFDFPVNMTLAPGPHQFGEPVSPPIAETLLPAPAPEENEAMPREVARWFDRAAEIPLVDRAEKEAGGVGADLSKVGPPVAVIEVVGQEENRDDGTVAYFLVSSLVLFSMSALVSFVTRKRVPYSLSDEPGEAGGQPAPPLLVLPVTSSAGD